MDPTELTAASLSDAIHDKEFSCREVMAAHLDRVDEHNPAVNAIVSLRDRDVLMTEAAACDEEIAHGLSRGWMHGFPLAVKDLAEARGLPATSGSPMFADWVPDFDCLVVARMKAAGAIVIGKTNVPEFGLGSHTFNEVFGTTVNAFDHTRAAGGSSGGAAVALALHMVPVADGSDYMGSLRNPAGWNGVVGLRPSQGRVPRWPSLDTYAAQLSTEGPMARTVLDTALLLGTQAGYDARAPLSLAGRLDELATVAVARETLLDDVAGVRVGWLGDVGGHLAMEDGVLDVCSRALPRLESLGCQLDAAALRMPPERVWEAWTTWRHQTVAASLAPLVADPARRKQMKPEALWEHDHGIALSGTDVARVARERTTFYASMLELFEDVDVLALPSAQVWPFPADQRWPARIGDRQMDTYHRWMEVTIYATFAGLPAISVPAGVDERGLPMGLQLIGRPRADLELLTLARAYESTLG